VRPPDKAGEGDGPAPCKTCPECDEIVHASIRQCPGCGFIFPPPEPKPLALRDDDIQGDGLLEFDVNDWSWSVQTAKSSGKDMLVVSYIGDDYARPLKEYLCIWHEGFAGKKGMATLNEIADQAGMTGEPESVTELLASLNRSKAPSLIKYRQDGKYKRIERREWSDERKAATAGGGAAGEWDDEVPF
jgi:DNA repair protein RadD